MDRKTIPIILLCVLLLLLSTKLINHYFPPIPVPVTTNAPAGTNLAATDSNAPAAGTAAMTASASNFTASFAPKAGAPEELLVISNQDVRCTFTSLGGGLKLVELPGYPETVHAIRRKAKPTNEVASLNALTAQPILALLGDESLQGDGVFKLSPIPGGVRAEKTLTNGLLLTKDFVLGTNYLVTVTVRLKNLTKQPLAVPTQGWVAGTATPLGPQDNSLTQSVMWYDGSQPNSVALSYFNTNRTTLGMFSRSVKTEYTGGSNNVSWVSAQNQFFALATMLESNQPASSVVVRMVDLPPPSEEEINESSRTVRHPEGLEALLTYPPMTLAADQERTLRFDVFAGPKEYHTVNSLRDEFNNRIDLVLGFNSWYSPISKALLVTMIWMHHALYVPYGLIIILITVTIRLVFWPLTRASTRSMKRMQELQPKIKAIQEKYKDDPQKQQAKTWEFYKENKVNPLGGCLPMLLQIPVFFGFFGMLRTAIELRGAPFLWIGDLSQPDTIFLLPILNFPVNPMPLIMACTQFWQASLMPASPGMDQSQQKMMRYMPLLMVYFIYNYSSGLALYWTVGNLITILQTKLTKTQPVLAAKPVPAVPARKK